MHLSTADVAAMLGLREQDVLPESVRAICRGERSARNTIFKTEIDEYILRQSIVVTPAYLTPGTVPRSCLPGFSSAVGWS